jgi:DNA polymerase III subunit delta
MATSSKTKAGIVLIAGSDEAAVKKNALERFESMKPSDPMNAEVVDARVDTVDEALRKIDELRAAILTLPFFGGGKLVWWKNVNFLDDSVVGRSASIKEALEKLVTDLEKVDGESVSVLISSLALHKGKAFTKALLKLAETTYFDLPDVRKGGEREMLEMIAQMCEQTGLHAGEGATERLFAALGYNTGALQVEIEKLLCYCGPGATVTRKEVQLLVGGKRDVLVWDFCDAVLAGDARAATSLLNQLIAQEESEVGLVIMLAGQIRLAALGGMLKEQGLMRLTKRGPFTNVELTPEGEAILPRKKTGEPISTFNLGNVAQKSSRKPAKFWFQAIEILHRACREMLSGTADKVRTLEFAVMELCAD